MNTTDPDSVASHLGLKHKGTCQDKAKLLAYLYLIIVSISPEEYLYVNALIVNPIPKLKKITVKNMIIINMVLYILTSSPTCNNISAVKNNLSMPYR